MRAQYVWLQYIYIICIGRTHIIITVRGYLACGTVVYYIMVYLLYITDYIQSMGT